MLKGSAESIGGVIGYTSRSDMMNCYATGKIQSIGQNTGAGTEGLNGCTRYSIINHAYATGEIKGQYCAGGLLRMTFQNKKVLNFFCVR